MAHGTASNFAIFIPMMSTFITRLDELFIPASSALASPEYRLVTQYSIHLRSDNFESLAKLKQAIRE